MTRRDAASPAVASWAPARRAALHPQPREGRTLLPSPDAEVLTMLTTILIIILILVLLGAVPAWPYSRGWGYGPSGIVGLILVILLILLLLGKI
jgi:sterol desaturase/sphingolipid hydroxylase (fatty acid hydroxylase superfamily)